MHDMTECIFVGQHTQTRQKQAIVSADAPECESESLGDEMRVYRMRLERVPLREKNPTSQYF